MNDPKAGGQGGVPETTPVHAEGNGHAPVAPAATQDGGGGAVPPGAAAGGPPGGGRGGGGRRFGMVDLSQGSIPKHLWKLSWPQVIESILNILDQMIDLVWAGRLPGGHTNIAALGVGQTFTQFGMMARQGFDTALRAMVSRAVGAGDIRLANHVVLQAFTLNVVYCIVLVVSGILLTDFLLASIGASDETVASAGMYMKVQFVGIATTAIRNMSGAALQASGDVITPLKATSITRIVHIVSSPFLMFGWLFFPEAGLAGAAWANVASQLAGAVLNYYALFNGSGRLHLTLKGYHMDLPLMKRMIGIGAPASATGTERAISQVVLMYIVSPFGDVALAAYALARRVEMFANFGSMGFAQASGIMVGQNLGAKKPERAKKALQWGLVFVAGFKFIVAIPLLLIPYLFLMIFTDNKDVLELGSDWLRIMAITAFFLGWGQVFAQTFNVAGDTITVMLVTLAAVLLVEMPMAYVYSHIFGMGPLGVAWAQLTAMVVRAGLFLPLYFWGRWLRIKVIEGYKMPVGGGGGH